MSDGVDAVSLSVEVVDQLQACYQLASALVESDCLSDLLKFSDENNLGIDGKEVCKLILSLTHDVSTLCDVIASENFCFDAEEQDFLVSYLNSVATDLSECLLKKEVITLFKLFKESDSSFANTAEKDVEKLLSSVFSALELLTGYSRGSSLSGCDSLAELFDLQEQMIDLSLALSLADLSHSNKETVVHMQEQLEEVQQRILNLIEDNEENVLGLSFDVSPAESEAFVEPMKILTTRLKIRGRSRPKKRTKHVTFQSFEEVFHGSDFEYDMESSVEELQKLKDEKETRESFSTNLKLSCSLVTLAYNTYRHLKTQQQLHALLSSKTP